jgi:hypothetical protein
MLNRSGDSGHPCLLPDFRGNENLDFFNYKMGWTRIAKGTSHCDITWFRLDIGNSVCVEGSIGVFLTSLSFTL